MQAIFVCWYNLARRHETIGQTFAIATGLVQKQWTVRELTELAAQA